jgi:hypothetical protein
MKTGRTLVDLAQEIERQAALKRDFITPTTRLRMDQGKSLSLLAPDGVTELFGVTEHAHRQISERLQIPAKYYDRLRTSHPDLLDQNVNTLFQRQPEVRMIRTLDGEARAFLSNRYRRLDHIDLMEHVLPELLHTDLKVVSCEITPSKLYLKFTSLSIQGEVKKGDVVEAGGVISNSEIGDGSISVFPFLNRLICLNGAVINDFGQRRYHVGKQTGGDEEKAMELFSDETIQADDKAFWLKIRDTIRSVVDQVQFDKLLVRLRESTEQKIEGDPKAVVVELSNRYQLDEGQRTSILRHLITDGLGLNAYGLLNAVTSVASEQESYDEASRLEVIGGGLISLPPTAWKELSRAA